MKRVFTVGVYDMLHKGHVELFRKAKSLGDILCVAVQDSDYVYKFKPEANLVNSTEERQYMVEAIRYVDETIIYTSIDDIIKTVPFDIFVTGPDQTHPGFQKAIKWCKQNGKSHIILPRTEGVSSTQIKLQISSNPK